MKLDLYDKKNTKVGDYEVSEDVFLEEPNMHLVHELLLLQHTRIYRLASAKTRSQVRGGGAKPWKQKGTGRARAGSIRSPLFKGGGVIFGPQFKKNKRSHMPKRARLKALCSALTFKKDELILLDELPTYSEPKTKEAIKFLQSFDAADKKVLILIDQHSEEQKTILKSFSNLKKCKVLHWQNLNPHDLFNSEVTLTDKAAFKNIENWLLAWKERKGSTNKVTQEAK
ncbi:MAG TPA: 50S ribosomal protein L4 [Vampirovibrionales bacterium]